MIGIKQISEFICRAICYFLLIDATDRKKLAAIEFDFFGLSLTLFCFSRTLPLSFQLVGLLATNGTERGTKYLPIGG